MTIWQFILAYTIVILMLPLIEKISELLISLIQIVISKVALRLHKLQSEIQELANPTPSNEHVIGFQYQVDEEDDEDE